MEGIGKLAGWQWIFILEGIVTVVVGAFAYFFIHNGPEEVKWLTEREREYVKYLLAYDGNMSGMGRSEDGSKRKYIKEAFLCPQVRTLRAWKRLLMLISK